jgi:hypothetical protein
MVGVRGGGAYRASSVCDGSRCDPATRLYADECCEIRVGLHVQDAPQRCACDEWDAQVHSFVSRVWLAPSSGLFAERWYDDWARQSG